MKLNLNLATRTYINRRALYTCYAAVIGILVLLLVMNLSRYIRMEAHNRQVKTELADVEEKLGILRDEGGEDVQPERFKMLEEKIAFANEVLNQDSFRWTELLDRLEEVLVEGASIRSIQPDYKDGSLKLAVTAQNVTKLREFIDSLILSPHFSYVYLLDQQKTEVKDNRGRTRDAVDFSLVVKGAF